MDKITSARATLRRLKQDDFENIRLLETDPEVMRFTPSRIPQSEDQTRKRLESQISKEATFAPFGIWVAESKQDSAFIGWFMLIPSAESPMELGFMIVQNHWGRGLTTEICRAILDFAHAQGIREFTARTNLDNTRSIRVLEKLGFGFIKNILVSDKGVEVELKVFSLKLS